MQTPLLRHKEKIGRFHIFFTIFISMFIMWACYYYVRTRVMGHTYPSANYAIKDLNPYISRLSNYPPLILAIAIIFSKMGDYDKFDIHTLQYTFNEPDIWRSFVLLIALYVIAVIGLCVYFGVKQVKKNGLKSCTSFISPRVID